jgi:hypothetical protein
MEGTRPVDVWMLIIELLVLGLIAYEVVSGWLRHREGERRRIFLGARVSDLSRLMDKGQRVWSSVLDPNITNFQVLQPWLDSAEAWNTETNDYLARYSPRASSAFMVVADAGTMDNVVFGSGRYFNLHGPVREVYQRLTVRLSNPRRIIEQADIYF